MMEKEETSRAPFSASGEAVTAARRPEAEKSSQEIMEDQLDASFVQSEELRLAAGDRALSAYLEGEADQEEQDDDGPSPA